MVTESRNLKAKRINKNKKFEINIVCEVYFKTDYELPTTFYRF